MARSSSVARTKPLAKVLALAVGLLVATMWVATFASVAHAAQEQPQGSELTSAHAADRTAISPASSKAKRSGKTLRDGLYNITPKADAEKAVSVKNGSKKARAKAALPERDKSNWAQKWAVTWNSSTGYYRIRNLNSRKCLGVSGKARSGSTIRQMNVSRSKTQLWEAEKTKEGVMFRLAESKLALTVVSDNAGSMALKLRKASSSNSAQRFKLRSANALEANQTYYLANIATNQRLHVSGDSRDGGAKLDLATAASTKSQKFRVLKSGSSYRLQNVRSCYYIGTNAKGKGAAYQYAKKHADRTKWVIDLDLKKAAFTLKSRVSGKALTASSGSLGLKKESNTDSQLFTFAKTYAFKLFLNPGHGWNSNGNGAWDSGATGSGHQEAEFSHDLCRRVEKLLAGTDVKVINGEKYRLAYWRRMPKAVRMGCDAIVSVHFDAGGGSGTLKMVGKQGRARGSDALANFVHRGVVSHLGLPSRGRSTRSDITCVNGSIPSMLTEICFMDNSSDVKTYLKKRRSVAKGLASGIKKASRSRKVIR